MSERFAAFEEWLDAVEDYFVTRYITRVEMPLSEGFKLTLCKHNGQRGLAIVTESGEEIPLDKSPLHRRIEVVEHLVDFERVCSEADEKLTKRIESACFLMEKFLSARKKAAP